MIFGGFGGFARFARFVSLFRVLVHAMYDLVLRKFNLFETLVSFMIDWNFFRSVTVTNFRLFFRVLVLSGLCNTGAQRVYI